MIDACALYRSIEVEEEEEEEEMELGWRAGAPSDVVEGWNRCNICCRALMGKTFPVLCRAHRGPVMNIKQNYKIPFIIPEENNHPPAEIQRPGLLGSPPHRRYVLPYPVYRSTLLPTPESPPTLSQFYISCLKTMISMCEWMRS